MINQQIHDPEKRAAYDQQNSQVPMATSAQAFAVPVAQAGVPVAQAGVPVAQAGVPMAQAGVPMAQAGVPMAQAGIPIAQAGVAVAVPVAGIAMPQQQPGFSGQAMAMPVVAVQQDITQCRRCGKNFVRGPNNVPHTSSYFRCEGCSGIKAEDIANSFCTVQ